MSWFDASGFASLAKTALKEAQKTIDKALDIKEEEQRSAETPVIDDTNFFATWGIKSDNSIHLQPPPSSSKQDSSIWGSFTGSFFETPGSTNETDNRVLKSSGSLGESSDQLLDTPAITSSLSLPDRLAYVQNERLSDSAHVPSSFSDDNSVERLNEQRKESRIIQITDAKSDTNSEIYSNRSNDDKQESFIHKINRVSIVSSGSDKKSSESVEILGSRSWTNTDCTTTPESDVSASDTTSSSTVDPKKNSESVEILPDSLVTSPSSVEVIEDRSKTESPFLSPVDSYPKSPDITTSIEPDSGESIQESSSDISPYASPMQESKTPIEDENSDEVRNFQQPLIPISGSIQEKPVSPATIENAASVDELDEISQCEDSYTSASESTVMTIMETLHHQMDQAKGKMHESCLEPSKSTCSASISSNQLETGVDSLKDVKQSLHLTLEPITTQPIRKTDNLAEKMESFDPDLVKSATIEPLNIDVLCSDHRKTGSQQNFTTTEPHSAIMLTDSSCEGTILDTSSEENVTLKNIKFEESELSEVPLSSSCYVKNMLADAMVEKSELLVDLERQEGPPREHSPISSGSRSDLVKIGSDQASGHTSGDELETTTSSDIEIISRYSPNGDSSSTQSRQSPANLHTNKGGDLLTKTLKTRGHSRELSEISIGSDDGGHEMEKLRKRIQDMNEILEVRESKLIDVSRINMDLHEQNNQLKVQLESWEKRSQQHQDLNLITDEYTQRMSALEKKFQQTIRERDVLKDQLEALKRELTSQTSLANIEKDEVIEQLREEGEKLSKQQLQHSNIIKKLRAKEKDNEVTIKNQKEQLDEQNSELDRLKRSLNAKEDVERSQIEAVHTLTARVKKQEREISSLQEKLDTTTHKMNAYKTSLDAAKTELAETKLNLSAIEEELKQVLENAGESCQLMVQVDDLKAKLRQEEEGHVKLIETMKQENHELLKRLEELKAESEEQSESVSLATKPLLRQLEQLQANLAQKSKIIVKQEKFMTDRIDELQTKLDNMTATDRSLLEENLNLKSKLSALESQIKRYDEKCKTLEESYEQSKGKNIQLSTEIARLKLMIESREKSHSEEMKELKREADSLRNKISIEKAAIDAEKRKNNPVLEQQQSIDESRVSPTSSVRRDSISSTNSVWLAFNDSVFDTSSGRFPNVYDGLRTSANTTSTIETLQAQLKAREGEIQTLQWEMSRRNTERDALNMELSNLTMKVEELSAKLIEVEALNTNLNEIQTRYDALLQMYGEKVEETEELRLDLEDVKDMYKSQIDQLLKRDI